MTRVICSAALAALLLFSAAARAGGFVEYEQLDRSGEVLHSYYRFYADQNGVFSTYDGPFQVNAQYAIPIASPMQVAHGWYAYTNCTFVASAEVLATEARIRVTAVTGTRAWEASWNAPGATGATIRGVAADQAGNAYVAAELAGVAQPSVVLKVASGWIEWAVAGAAGIRALALDQSTGAVVATGVDGYGTVALTPAGAIAWSTAVDGTLVASAADARVAVVGSAGGDVRLTVLGSAGGAPLWTRSWSLGPDTVEQPTVARFHPGGDLWVAGQTWAGAASDAFVLRFGGSGLVWQQTLDAGGVEVVADLALAPVWERETDSVYVGGATVDATGFSRALFAKLAADGTVLADHVDAGLGESAVHTVNTPNLVGVAEFAGRRETFAADGSPLHGTIMRFFEDLDRDGYSTSWLAPDCDDRRADVSPGATEIPYDGLDNDCNQQTVDDDLDYDGYLRAQDCDDSDWWIHPDGIELAFDAVDQNCNGMGDDGTGPVVARWRQAGSPIVRAIHADAAGGLYATTDTNLVKYDAREGALLWGFGPFGAVAFSDQGDTLVLASATAADGGFAIGVTKLAPDGSVAWTTAIPRPGATGMSVHGMIVDAAGSMRAVVTAGAPELIVVDPSGNPLSSTPVIAPGGVAMDRATGETWVSNATTTARYGADGALLRSFAAGGGRMAVDLARGRVAFSETVLDATRSSSSTRTRVYSSTGAYLWSATFARPGLRFNDHRGSAFDGEGNLWVWGQSAHVYGQVFVVKYDGLTGATLWTLMYVPSWSNGPSALAFDKHGFAYLTGYAWDETNGYRLFLVKVSPAGQIVWQAIHRDRTRSHGVALHVTEALEVYVGGYVVRHENGAWPNVGLIVKYEQDLDLDGWTHRDDCDDSNVAVHPGAAEIPYDGIDQNCNGPADDVDADGDGFVLAQDCNDADPAMHPGAAEIPYDGIDQNCNGLADDDDLDRDGHPRASDCNEFDPSVYAGAPEVNGDGIDQDCNGYDLTIVVAKAHYRAATDELRVEATTALGPAARLALVGYRPMSWRPNQAGWAVTVVPAGGHPVTVTVCGVEGCVSAPVVLQQ